MERRKITYRLYPLPTQAAALMNLLKSHQQLYNAALEQRIDAWRRRGVSISYKDQCAELTELRRQMPEWALPNCSSQQRTLRRLDKAMKAFFRRVKAGETPGFPRFKSLHRFRSFGFKSHGDGWCFQPGPDWKHGRLRLAGVGTIKARGRARTQGRIKACEIRHDDGLWELSLTIECDPKRQRGDEWGSFDLGVENFAAIASVNSAGKAKVDAIANPRLGRGEREKIDDLRRDLACKKPGGANRKKSRRRLRKALRRQANRRRDFLHQTSARKIKRFALLATEALEIKKMTASAKGTVDEPGRNVKQKAGLNRELLDVSLAQYLSLVRYKAAEAGTELAIAPTRSLKPSQRCPCCWSVEKKALSQRIHHCPTCGYRTSRDAASAEVVLVWAVMWKTIMLREIARANDHRTGTVRLCGRKAA